MRKFLRFLFSLLLIFSILLFNSCGKAASQEEEFNSFCQLLFAQEVSSDALTLQYCLKNASGLGIEKAVSPLGHPLSSSTSSELDELEAQLRVFQPECLTKEQQFSYDCIWHALSTAKKMSKFTYYKEYLSPRGGEQVDLLLLLSEMPIRSAQEAEIYLQIAEALPSYFDEVLSFEKEKAKLSLFMSDHQLQSTLESIQEMKELLEKGYLTDSLLAKLTSFENLSQEEKDSYKKRMEDLTVSALIPCYEKMYTELAALKGSGKNDLGLCYLPEGRAYYEGLLQNMLDANLSVPDYYEKIQSAISTDLSCCANLIAQNPDILKECENITVPYDNETESLDHLMKALQEDFPKACTDSYKIAFSNEGLADFVAPAYYLTAPYDDMGYNNIFINGESNCSNIHYFATLAHEGYPGHLYQTTMSYHYGVPWIRLILGNSAFTEGWATYAENYAFSFTNISPEAATLLQKNRAILLGLYALSDLGIHYYGWNETDMLALWKDYGVTSKTTLKSIMDLIISSPGGYLKYYGGYLEILELKEMAKTTYKNSYSDYDFHRTLLRMGPAPFHLIKKYFNDYFSRSI